MKTVYDALDPIVNGSATTKEKGDNYEAACPRPSRRRSARRSSSSTSRAATAARSRWGSRHPRTLRAKGTSPLGTPSIALNTETGEWEIRVVGCRRASAMLSQVRM